MFVFLTERQSRGCSNGIRGERPETHLFGDRVVRQVEGRRGRQLALRSSTTRSCARETLGRLFLGIQQALFGTVGIAQKSS